VQRQNTAVLLGHRQGGHERLELVGLRASGGKVADGHPRAKLCHGPHALGFKGGEPLHVGHAVGNRLIPAQPIVDLGESAVAVGVLLHKGSRPLHRVTRDGLILLQEARQHDGLR